MDRYDPHHPVTDQIDGVPLTALHHCLLRHDQPLNLPGHDIEADRGRGGESKGSGGSQYLHGRQHVLAQGGIDPVHLGDQGLRAVAEHDLGALADAGQFLLRQLGQHLVGRGLLDRQDRLARCCEVPRFCPTFGDHAAEGGADPGITGLGPGDAGVHGEPLQTLLEGVDCRLGAIQGGAGALQRLSRDGPGLVQRLVSAVDRFLGGVGALGAGQSLAGCQ